jgi:hypothetical protein
MLRSRIVIRGDCKGQSNGRGVGWEYVHVCIDDHSSVACAKVMPDEKKRGAIAFLSQHKTGGRFPHFRGG